MKLTNLGYIKQIDYRNSEAEQVVPIFRIAADSGLERMIDDARRIRFYTAITGMKLHQHFYRL